MLDRGPGGKVNIAGFSLIEIMVVIAIIGLLATIAIPNYISYRNKGFCSHAESDASTIANEIAAYFAVPAHSHIDKTCIASASVNNKNWDITPVSPNHCITITVHDDSGRCPPSYQQASPHWNSGVFTKRLKL